MANIFDDILYLIYFALKLHLTFEHRKAAISPLLAFSQKFCMNSSFSLSLRSSFLTFRMQQSNILHMKNVWSVCRLVSESEKVKVPSFEMTLRLRSTSEFNFRAFSINPQNSNFVFLVIVVVVAILSTMNCNIVCRLLNTLHMKRLSFVENQLRTNFKIFTLKTLCDCVLFVSLPENRSFGIWRESKFWVGKLRFCLQHFSFCILHVCVCV